MVRPFITGLYFNNQETAVEGCGMYHLAQVLITFFGVILFCTDIWLKTVLSIKGVWLVQGGILLIACLYFGL